MSCIYNVSDIDKLTPQDWGKSDNLTLCSQEFFVMIYKINEKEM